MDAIIDWLVAFWEHIKTALSWCLDGFLYVLKSALYFLFDGLLTTIYAIVGALDVGSLLVNIGGLWLGLPPQLLYLINAIGIPTGLTMLSYAILVRKLLDLIPAAFTRF